MPCCAGAAADVHAVLQPRQAQRAGRAGGSSICSAVKEAIRRAQQKRILAFVEAAGDKILLRSAALGYTGTFTAAPPGARSRTATPGDE